MSLPCFLMNLLIQLQRFRGLGSGLRDGRAFGSTSAFSARHSVQQTALREAKDSRYAAPLCSGGSRLTITKGCVFLLNLGIRAALYEKIEAEELLDVEQIRKEETLTLDQGTDYYDPRLNLSNEVRESLSEHRPVSVSRARGGQGRGGRACNQLHVPEEPVAGGLTGLVSGQQVGAASRIPGVTPAAILSLLHHLKRLSGQTQPAPGAGA